MEKVYFFNREEKDLQYIDEIGGGIKFDGNLSQYKNMLTMFDKLTLDEYIVDLANLLKKEDVPQAIIKLRYLSEAASYNFLFQLSQNHFFIYWHI